MRHARWIIVAAWGLLAWLATNYGNWALAQDDPPPSRPLASAMVSPDISRLEDEIAQLEQKRAITSPALLPWLDLQIDSRILCRWLVWQVSGSKEESQFQIGAFLHARSMEALIPAIDDFAARQTDSPNSVQAGATQRIHGLTYQLKDAKELAELDKTTAQLAEDVLIVITPLHGGDQLPPIIPMRPTAVPAADDNASGQKRNFTADQLASEARQASVSPGLRQELIAMANQAQQLQGDPSQADEVQALCEKLQTAIELSSGLQSNTGVTPDEREELESQLCNGLSLFADPRMRATGLKRLAALDEYRRLLDRVARMRIPAELKVPLAPAIAWAHQNPSQAERVLGPVERFIALYNRQGKDPREPATITNLKAVELLRRAYEAIEKRSSDARSAFLWEAGNLGGAPPPAGASPAHRRDEEGADQADATPATVANGPEGLRQAMETADQLQNLLDALAELPHATETLDAYKPRPTGGVEQHVNALLIKLLTPNVSPAADVASRQLIALYRLSTISDELTNLAPPNVPQQIAQDYAGNNVDAVQSKWKARVGELATAFAANQPLDETKIDQLRAVKELFTALGRAADFEAAVAKTDALAKWADWTVTPDQLHSLVAPYEQAMSGAFSGFVSDDVEAIAALGRLRRQYEPVLALLMNTAGYTDSCSGLPGGPLGLIDRLATPYDKAPFADQRFVSFETALAASAGGDSGAEQNAASAISRHLHR